MPAERAGEILRSLDSSRAEVRTGRGTFAAEVKKSIGRQAVRQVVAFERPSRLRIELFASSLEQLAGLSVVRDGLLESLDPKEKVLFRGYAGRENIERLFGLPFVADEFALWLMGRVPELLEPEVAQDGEMIGVRGRLDELNTLSAKLQKTNDGSFRMTELEVRRGETVYFRSELTYGRDDIPSEIRFELSEHGVEAVLTRESFTVNPELPADRLFRIRVPEGIRVEILR